MEGDGAGLYLAIYGTGVFISWMVGASKGKAATGFLVGLLLSWLGVVVMLLTRTEPAAQAKAEGRVPCPFCAEPILPAAKVCPHCGREVGLASPAPGTTEGWLLDPSGRHPDRWWDGTAWTQWVRDRPGGTRSEDPPLVTPS